MGVKISAMVFASGPRVLAQHSVMIALADNADDFGIAWPGLELLADKSRMTIRNLSRVLDALERDGWLVRRSRARGEHRRGSVYELNMARLGAPLHGADTALHAADTRVAREGHETQPRGVRAASAPRETNRSTARAKRVPAPCNGRLDTVSSHAADEGADAAACAPRLDILSDAAEAVQSEPVTGHPGQRDWTSSAPRLDIALADLVLAERDAKQNRQEPPLEPSLPPKPPRGGGIAYSLDAAREVQAHGDGEDAGGVGLTADELEELAEVNAIRARRTPPEPPWPAAEWARLRVQEARIANPTDPMPVRSRRRRWNRA